MRQILNKAEEMIIEGHVVSYLGRSGKEAVEVIEKISHSSES